MENSVMPSRIVPMEPLRDGLCHKVMKVLSLVQERMLQIFTLTVISGKILLHEDEVDGEDEADEGCEVIPV